MKHPPPQLADSAFTIPEFIVSHKLSRTRLYEEIASGRLSSYKVGSRRFISARAADEWQRSLELETAREAA